MRSDGDVPSRSFARVALMFWDLQTWSKSAEINHEGREGHKEFATHGVTRPTSKIQVTDTGLISARLFTYILSCLRLLTEHRGGRLIKALKTVLLRLLPRIGAWC
jgi:hypothetical protein